MKLSDLTWDTFEPLVDLGLFPTAECPSCGTFGVVNVWEQPGGWLVQCVACRHAVPAADTRIVRKAVVEALGHSATVLHVDRPPFRRQPN